MTKTEKDVNDGFSYFNSGILEELTTDKKYYVKAFMDYIQELESKINIIMKVKNPRKEMIDFIMEYAGDEIESINDALKIAKMTDKELKDDIDNIIEYYKREHKKIIEYNKRK